MRRDTLMSACALAALLALGATPALAHEDAEDRAEATVDEGVDEGGAQGAQSFEGDDDEDDGAEGGRARGKGGKKGKKSSKKKKPKKPTFAQEMARVELKPLGARCEAFGAYAVTQRKRLWLAAIQAYAKHSPEQVHGWIIGKIKPPKAVIAESEHQLRCMLGAMFDEAAREKNPKLTMDVADKLGQTAKARKTRADRFHKHASTRARMIRHINRSFYRSSWAQGQIWYNKFVFASRNFNHVSPHAASRCKGVKAKHSWKPKTKAHRDCWLKTLKKTEREQEILNASSAPGISRHHWGTEFDLFSLNPYRFKKKAELYDEYSWMKRSGMKYGFFQPYTGREKFGEYAYMEERWHWSYYPIAQALTEYSLSNEAAVKRALEAQWSDMEKRWGAKKGPYFDFVRKHWREYMLEHINDVAIAGIFMPDLMVYAFLLPGLIAA